MDKPFWVQKTLAEMNESEWEQLCDGCAQCCLVKLEDEDSGEVYRTSVSCQLLDTDSCRCKDYPNRLAKIPDCVQVSLRHSDQFSWMPETCAYRLIYEGKLLPDWHPLISGSAQTVHEAGASVRDYAISEEFVHPDQQQEFIIGMISTQTKNT